jgi:hypothetical protein
MASRRFANSRPQLSSYQHKVSMLGPQSFIEFDTCTRFNWILKIPSRDETFVTISFRTCVTGSRGWREPGLLITSRQCFRFFHSQQCCWSVKFCCLNRCSLSQHSCLMFPRAAKFTPPQFVSTYFELLSSTDSAHIYSRLVIYSSRLLD